MREQWKLPSCLLLFLVIATIAVINDWFNEVKEAMDNNSIYNDYYNNDDT
jgi:hypothetical protein